PFTAPSPPLFYTLSLHDALPISLLRPADRVADRAGSVAPGVLGQDLCHLKKERLRCPANPLHHLGRIAGVVALENLKHRSRVLRSEEHTSELQSPCNLVCRLLLE